MNERWNRWRINEGMLYSVRMDILFVGESCFCTFHSYWYSLILIKFIYEKKLLLWILIKTLDFFPIKKSFSFICFSKTTLWMIICCSKLPSLAQQDLTSTWAQWRACSSTATWSLPALTMALSSCGTFALETSSATWWHWRVVAVVGWCGVFAAATPSWCVQWAVVTAQKTLNCWSSTLAL